MLSVKLQVSVVSPIVPMCRSLATQKFFACSVLSFISSRVIDPCPSVLIPCICCWVPKLAAEAGQPPCEEKVPHSDNLPATWGCLRDRRWSQNAVEQNYGQMYAHTDARVERWSCTYVTLIHSMENNTHIADVNEAVLIGRCSWQHIHTIIQVGVILIDSLSHGRRNLIGSMNVKSTQCNSMYSVPVASSQWEYDNVVRCTKSPSTESWKPCTGCTHVGKSIRCSW